jgi:hypothetical protein
MKTGKPKERGVYAASSFMIPAATQLFHALNRPEGRAPVRMRGFAVYLRSSAPIRGFPLSLFQLGA